MSISPFAGATVELSTSSSSSEEAPPPLAMCCANSPKKSHSSSSSPCSELVLTFLGRPRFRFGWAAATPLDEELLSEHITTFILRGFKRSETPRGSYIQESWNVKLTLYHSIKPIKKNLHRLTRWNLLPVAWSGNNRPRESARDVLQEAIEFTSQSLQLLRLNSNTATKRKAYCKWPVE